jgi:acetyltransferase-like isoleucine patch superfamily enzyme
MLSIINWLILKFKKETFLIDNRIPSIYLIGFILNKVKTLICGFIIFGRKNRCFIHTSAVIKCKKKILFGSNLTIDRYCFIDALSTTGISFGSNVSIGKNTTIECTGSLKSIGTGLVVGDNVGLGTNGFFGCAGGIVIGDDTIFGNFVSMHSENHNYKDLDIPIRLQGVNRKGIRIGKNCWIGAKVTILDGVSIEDGCIIAAGSVVTEGIYLTNGIYGGVPAKLIKMR